MQLLERKDGKKWYVWVQFGRVNAENSNEKTKDFFNKFDAIASFEEKFFERTGNKWQDRESFSQKPGKYSLVKSEQEKEIRTKCAENEKELINTIQESF